MLPVLLFVLIAVAFGGYTTWLLATVVPSSVLARAARHGRFAALSGDPCAAVSDAKCGTRPDACARAQSTSNETAHRC